MYMEKKAKTVVYVICIDNGFIICNEKEDHLILPAIVLNEQFEDLNVLKSKLIKEARVSVQRHNLYFLRYYKEENINFYSLVIDLNQKGNNSVLHSKALVGAKGLKFLGSTIAKWDGGSRLAIESLRYNPNFKDAFLFIESDNKFNYYSKSSKRIINRVFDKVSNIWQSDKPDVIVETLDGVTGVECFKISASGKHNNGSVGIVGKKEMENELMKGNYWEPITVSRHFSNSLSNLWDDFDFQFKSHNKAREYRANLKKVVAKGGIRHSLGLYVEDTTLLGSYYKEKGKNLVPFYIFNIKEFWDLFLNSKGILFIIFQQTEGDNKGMYFITKHDYQILLNKGLIQPLDAIETQFFDNPHLIGTSFPFPDS